MTIALRAGLRRLGVGLLDTVLPPHCLSCDEGVEVQGTLCPACFRATHSITEPFCTRCGVPFLHAGQGVGGLCPACLTSAPTYDSARAALHYDDGARRLLLPFKHADRPELAGPLAARMVRAGRDLLARADLVAPVPLHWLRLWARRYNQAALLGRRVARQAGLPFVPDLLTRTRATPPMGDRTAAERTALLARVFRVHPRRAAAVAGKRVLLIDDVMTSGATVEACALVLRAAGATGVDVLAAARVPDPRLAERA